MPHDHPTASPSGSTRWTAELVDKPAQNAPSGDLVGRRPQSRPRKIARLWGTTLAAVILLAAAWLGLRYGRSHTVEQFVINKGTFSVQLSGPGTLDATKKAVISARVQGRLTDVLVDRNDSIAEKYLIARIASDDLQSQLAASVAAHDAAKLGVVQARADKTRSEATLANAQGAFSRQKTLLSREWATQATYDSAVASLRQSEAELAHAIASVDAAQAQERSAAATVRVNQAQLEETIIRAPFAGTIVSRDRNLGDMVTPGASIVQLIDPSTIVLTARFDESAIASIRPGQAATLSFTSQPERPINGHVLRLGRQVDSETREFTVDLTPDELPTNWAIGQRGTASIILAKLSDVLSVPSRFVARKDGHAGLWIVRGGRAHWRPIKIGRMGNASVEIRNGLNDGDRVLAPSGAFEWMSVRKLDTP